MVLGLGAIADLLVGATQGRGPVDFAANPDRQRLQPLQRIDLFEERLSFERFAFVGTGQKLRREEIGQLSRIACAPDHIDHFARRHAFFIAIAKGEVLDQPEHRIGFDRIGCHFRQAFRSGGNDVAGGIDLGKANAGHAFNHDLDATGFTAFEVDDFDQGTDAMEGIGGAFFAAGSLHGEDQFLIGGQRFLDCEDRARLADEQGDDVARKDHHFLHRKQWQPLTKEIEAAHRVLR